MIHNERRKYETRIVLRSSFSLFSEERSSIIIIILFLRGSSNGFTTTTQKQMNISDNISAIKCH